ncbi:hypothetical protein OG921_16000 [Aldersonia sp. NBC_00410]|uniref:hypothetical protein n=1 Tax=Aldersonia sp. NBC_00410 TaxID=2975954 RepID=UPI002259B677|nr:hypothetical protein [Aldersonia sp. NBC_00410]MCX5044670.1 hypothetical protein [Aldersonia sp. NBC_00410]
MPENERRMATSSTGGESPVTELIALRGRLIGQVGRSIQLPEPGFTLDLANRAESDVRAFKHIHQTCMLHRENFVAANQIKHLYLIDGFLTLIEAQNPVALYGVARSMVELSAFLHEISTRLQDVVLRLDDRNWKPLGEKFFGLIVRARFATTHPQFRALLAAEGLTPTRLKPFNIGNCIDGLTTEPDHQDAKTRYASLCDFVHHNLSSSSVSNSGSGVVDVARSAGGGELRHPDGSLTVTQYEYPARGKAAQAVDNLASDFLRDARACINWINMLPGSPFPQQMVTTITGHPTGLKEV